MMRKDPMRFTRIGLVGLGAAAIAGAGVAIAVADSASDPDAGMVKTATATTVSTTAPTLAVPPRPPTSLALRAAVIGKVALLRAPATADDAIPDSYAPSTEPDAPTSITEGDLQLARKLPGVSSTWVVPLETGALALVTSNGGAQFSPQQLDTGGVVQVTYHNGSTVVAGVVPDGTTNVGIDTSTGDSEPADVAQNVYTRTFPADDARGRPTAITLTTQTGSHERFKLSGDASESP